MKELNVFMLLYLSLGTNNNNYIKIIYAAQNIKLDKVVEWSNKYCEKRSINLSQKISKNI